MNQADMFEPTGGQLSVMVDKLTQDSVRAMRKSQFLSTQGLRYAALSHHCQAMDHENNAAVCESALQLEILAGITS